MRLGSAERAPVSFRTLRPIPTWQDPRQSGKARRADRVGLGSGFRISGSGHGTNQLRNLKWSEVMTTLGGRRALDIINPEGLYDPSPYGYSHVAVLKPGFRLVAIAGQGGETAEGGPTGDFRTQTRQTLNNLAIAVQSAGGTLKDVMKQTILIVDHTEEKLHILVEEFEFAYGAGAKPACTLIPVPRLALDGMLIEIDAWAAIPAD